MRRLWGLNSVHLPFVQVTKAGENAVGSTGQGVTRIMMLLQLLTALLFRLVISGPGIAQGALLVQKMSGPNELGVCGTPHNEWRAEILNIEAKPNLYGAAVLIGLGRLLHTTTRERGSDIIALALIEYTGTQYHLPATTEAERSQSIC